MPCSKLAESPKTTKKPWILVKQSFSMRKEIKEDCKKAGVDQKTESMFKEANCSKEKKKRNLIRRTEMVMS
jgi:hypothetical protein